MSTPEEKAKNREKQRRFREKHAARLAAEYADRKAERRRMHGDARSYGRALYRCIELVNSAGVPVQCLVVKDGQAYVLPSGLTPAKLLMPDCAMSRAEAHAHRRMWYAVLTAPLPAGDL